VPQATIAALAEGSWIDDREQIVLIGESGSGKTHLAISLAICARQQGRRVRFTTLAQLANEPQEAESRRELQRVVSRYARVELLVLDELGYLALPEGAAELVFQVISEPPTSPSASEQNSSPTRARRSSTASPTAPTSSRREANPGAPSTASPAASAEEGERN
jgi:ABC-type oligopeptide transport system ATPase subunit